MMICFGLFDLYVFAGPCSNIHCAVFSYRKIAEDDAAGEAYFQADKAFLQSMVDQRNDELQSKCLMSTHSVTVIPLHRRLSCQIARHCDYLKSIL